MSGNEAGPWREAFHERIAAATKSALAAGAHPLELGHEMMLVSYFAYMGGLAPASDKDGMVTLEPELQAAIMDGIEDLYEE